MRVTFVHEYFEIFQFEIDFKGKYTHGFEVAKHFQKIGVINQTTMLATETEEIASFFKSVLIKNTADGMQQDFTMLKEFQK